MWNDNGLFSQNKNIEELYSNSPLLDIIVKSLNIGVIISDNDGKIINYNEIYERLWSYPDKIISSNSFIVRKEWMKKDIKDKEELDLVIEKVIENQEISIDLEMKNGKVYLFKSKPYYINDKVLGRVSYFKDITQQKEFEKKLLIREKKYKKLANIDYLTDIYNRRKINELIDFNISLKRKYDISFSILMMDIDYFKDINDKFGHAMGDKILLELTQTISKIIRKNDAFGRWGGDELIIVAGDTDKKGAIYLAERIHQVLNNHQFTKNLKVTCSIGVTTFNNDDSLSTMMDRVDKAMYEVKKKGKNNYVFK